MTDQKLLIVTLMSRVMILWINVCISNMAEMPWSEQFLEVQTHCHLIQTSMIFSLMPTFRQLWSNTVTISNSAIPPSMKIFIDISVAHGDIEMELTFLNECDSMICTLSINLNTLHSAKQKNDCPDICQDCHYRQLSSSNWKHCMLKLVCFHIV